MFKNVFLKINLFFNNIINFFNIKGIRATAHYKYLFRENNVSETKKTNNPVFLHHMVGSIIFIVLSYQFTDIHNSLEKEINKFQGEVVVMIDYYSSSYCSNVKKNERVLFLKGKVISVAFKEEGNWKFKVINCIF